MKIGFIVFCWEEEEEGRGLIPLSWSCVMSCVAPARYCSRSRSPKGEEIENKNEISHHVPLVIKHQIPKS